MACHCLLIMILVFYLIPMFIEWTTNFPEMIQKMQISYRVFAQICNLLVVSFFVYFTFKEMREDIMKLISNDTTKYVKKKEISLFEGIVLLCVYGVFIIPYISWLLYRPEKLYSSGVSTLQPYFQLLSLKTRLRLTPTVQILMNFFEGEQVIHNFYDVCMIVSDIFMISCSVLAALHQLILILLCIVYAVYKVYCGRS